MVTSRRQPEKEDGLPVSREMGPIVNGREHRRKKRMPGDKGRLCGRKGKRGPEP